VEGICEKYNICIVGTCVVEGIYEKLNTVDVYNLNATEHKNVTRRITNKIETGFNSNTLQVSII
jgi:hypothetical protein